MRLIGLAVVLAFSVNLAPHAVEAQTTRVPRIGYLVLSPLVDPPSAERQAFRSANWNRELLPDLAAELVDLKVDVIVAVPGTYKAARDATKLAGGCEFAVRGSTATVQILARDLTGGQLAVEQLSVDETTRAGRGLHGPPQGDSGVPSQTASLRPLRRPVAGQLLGTSRAARWSGFTVSQVTEVG